MTREELLALAKRQAHDAVDDIACLSDEKSEWLQRLGIEPREQARTLAVGFLRDALYCLNK